MFMALISVVGIYLWWRGTLEQTRWFLLALPFAIVLPYIANSTGWMLTELGRQPWIVQGLMRTEAGLSPNLTTTDLWISLIGFTLVYGTLAVADFYLLWKFGSTGTGDSEVLPMPSPQSDKLQLENVY
jgi:cytochrome bd ubiquinol oxidase subunit I